MRLVLATLAAATLSPACAPADTTIDHVYDACSPLSIVPSAGTTPAQSESLGEAIAMWNSSAGTHLAPEALAGAPQVALRFQSAASAFFGVYDDEAMVVIVNQRIEDPRERAVTLAHELGHVMGLVHVSPDERLSVMNPANLQVTPTVEDRAALRSLWGDCAE